MRTGDAFPGKWLKAHDLNGKHVLVTIDKVTIEDVGNGKKPVLWLKGKDKALVLNKTNSNAIAKYLDTDEMDDWKGHQVVLFPTETEFVGEQVDCIRVKRAQAGQDSKPAARKPEPEPEDFGAEDDDVPF